MFLQRFTMHNGREKIVYQCHVTIFGQKSDCFCEKSNYKKFGPFSALYWQSENNSAPGFPGS
jgi:hypothetical protein